MPGQMTGESEIKIENISWKVEKVRNKLLENFALLHNCI
jgi:hypothetical protein